MLLLRRWLPVLLWAAGTLVLAGRLGSAARTGGWLLPWLEGWGLAATQAQAWHIGLRKAGHALAYATFAALAWRALDGRARRGLLALGLAVLLAVLDEATQARSPLREGSPWDVLLDAAGAGAALAWLAWRRARAGRAPALSPPGA
ncbi:MAG: VanZ family protein [Planctomycetia bacterium]